MNLRPFTDADWQAFEGCESEAPLIGENPDVTVIVDGCLVQAFYDHEPAFCEATAHLDQPCSLSFSFEFATPAAANLAASLIDGPVAARTWLRRIS